MHSDIFDNLKRFESWFAFDEKTMEDEDQKQALLAQEREHQIVSKLHAILRPFVMRRTKGDVDLSIPDKREIVLYTPLTPLQE